MAHHLVRIGNIEAWSASGTPVKAVLARLERDMHGGILEPLSLVVEAGGTLRAITLDYVAPPASRAPSFVSRIARMVESTTPRVPWMPGPVHLAQLDALLALMENKAMTGRLHVVGEERDDLLTAQRFLRATGIDTVADAVERYLAVPDGAKALALVHLCHTCADLDTSFIFH